jgi:DNA polymerase III sliding clamp (beta) subunit (PCNA family)
VADLQALAETEHEDPEYVPTILPVDARLAVRGPVSVLQALFDRAASVIPAKEIIAGTAYALLEAVPGQPGTLPYVRLSATDGSMSVQMVADGIEVRMPGSALVPGKKISDILKLAPTSTAAIEILGNTAMVRSGRAQWEVQTPVGDALAAVADVSGIHTHTVPVQALLEALSITRKAASVSDARASLKQILVKNGSLTALDGGRLHRQRVTGLPVEADMTIPLKVADEVMRLLRASSSEHLEMGGNSSHIVFRVDQDVIGGQRPLVDFPDVENQVLGPALTNSWSLSLDRERLTEAIKRVRVNADPDYAAIFMTLVPGKTTVEGSTWTLTLSARDKTGNAARESLDASWSGPGGNRALCVNHRFLSDLLSVMDGEHAIFRVGEDSKTQRMPLFVENTVTGFTGWVQQIRPGYLA